MNNVYQEEFQVGLELNRMDYRQDQFVIGGITCWIRV